MTTYDQLNNFFIDAHLDATRKRIYSSKRQAGNKFASAMIVSCEQDNWWYKNYIGIEIFVELRFTKYMGGFWLSDTNVVLLTNTKILIGRSISPNDIIIL